MIYYAHSRMIYDSKLEAYYYEFIRKMFNYEDIINPSSDIPQDIDNDLIMELCYDRISRCDVLVFTCIDGYVGIGVYNEVKHAFNCGACVYLLIYNKLILLKDMSIFDVIAKDNYWYARIKLWYNHMEGE